MKRTKTSAKGKKKLPIDWRAATQFPVPIPHDEPERVADLHQYEILDTLPEEEFDTLTLLASQICNTPIAMISLLDSDRQWFKSKVGLGLSETSRDIAFCAHAIMQPDLFIVPDASKDRRFLDNPFVRAEPKIRFYAGAPLVSRQNHALGTLCVMDREARQLTSGQKESLRALSRAVMARLEMRRRLEELERALQGRASQPKKPGKPARAESSRRPSPVEFLRKSGYQTGATAQAIANVTQRALRGPCTPDQNDCLKAAYSNAQTLIALSREMKLIAQAANDRAYTPT